MTYTELVVTENESMHPNIEFTHQKKVCYYLKAKKADCIEPEKILLVSELINIYKYCSL